MAEETGSKADSGGSGRAPWRAVAWSALRATGFTAALVTIYYMLPLTRARGWAGAAILCIGLVLLIGLVAFQVRVIIASSFPTLRGIEALATSVPLLLLLFAATYAVLAMMSASNFGHPLSRTDALYFSVTVFSTVGSGDIIPATQAARLVVTGQMIADLIATGIALRVIVGAVQHGRSRN